MYMLCFMVLSLRPWVFSYEYRLGEGGYIEYAVCILLVCVTLFRECPVSGGHYKN
jgi:hypothetical protein